jgi:hypothetical protein
MKRESYFGLERNGPVMTTDSLARHSISQTSISHVSTVLPPTGGARMSTSQFQARIDPASTQSANQNQNTNTTVPVRGNGTTAAVNIDDIMSMVAARLDPSFLARSGIGCFAELSLADACKYMHAQ